MGWVSVQGMLFYSEWCHLLKTIIIWLNLAPEKLGKVIFLSRYILMRTWYPVEKQRLQRCLSTTTVAGEVWFNVDGYPVKVFDKGKTLCDIIFYRNKIGQDIVREALDSYIRNKDKNIQKLMQYADILRVSATITVRNSNRIIVLEHGEVVEQGTHEELLAIHGRYHQLYTGAVELD
jgi:hypothetical protein